MLRLLLENDLDPTATVLAMLLHDGSDYIAIATVASEQEVLQHFAGCTVIEQVTVDVLQMPQVVRGMVTAAGLFMQDQLHAFA
jgi:hypothetical protein